MEVPTDMNWFFLQRSVSRGLALMINRNVSASCWNAEQRNPNFLIGAPPHGPCQYRGDLTRMMAPSHVALIR